MAAGDIILATKYNTMFNQVGGVLAAYGQNLQTGNTVTAGSDRVTPAQWDALKTEITKCYRHQNGYTPSYPSDIATGNIIKWSSVSTYENLASSVASNQNTVYTGGTGGIYTQQQSSYTTGSKTISSGWNTSKVVYWYLDWSSWTDKYTFFALGGKLVFNCNMVGAESPNLGWTGVLNSLNGAYYDTTKFYGGDSSSGKIYDTTAPYKDNYGMISVIRGPDTRLYVVFELHDDKVANPNFDENVGNDINCSITLYKSIGEFTAPLPTITIA